MVHDGDLARDVHRLRLIVGDEDRRDVHFLVQAPEPVAELGGRARRARRTARQEEAAGLRECTREGHSLALSPRQLRGIATGERFELDEPQELVDAFADLRPWTLANGEPEGDVVADGHVLERCVVLEDEADVPLLRLEGRGVDAGDLDLPAVRPLEAGDDPQERRLARSARAEQR